VSTSSNATAPRAAAKGWVEANTNIRRKWTETADPSIAAGRPDLKYAETADT
jgi:ABC-type proline/glycine betaine transport system substrate-binding protein